MGIVLTRFTFVMSEFYLPLLKNIYTYYIDAQFHLELTLRKGNDGLLHCLFAGSTVFCGVQARLCVRAH